MAKKKSSPFKECPACGKKYHPRCLVCPHCQAQNPSAPLDKKPKTVKKKATASVGVIDAASQFVAAAGGMEQAEDALRKIRDMR